MTTSKSSQESLIQAGANFTFEHLGADASFMPSINGFAAFHISKQPTEYLLLDQGFASPKNWKKPPRALTPLGRPSRESKGQT